MMYADILEEIISGLRPETLPADYIVMAKIIDVYGREHILKGDTLKNFMANPNRGYGVSEARVILDVGKIRSVIVQEVSEFFTDLQMLIDELPPVDINYSQPQIDSSVFETDEEDDDGDPFDKD